MKFVLYPIFLCPSLSEQGIFSFLIHFNNYVHMASAVPYSHIFSHITNKKRLLTIDFTHRDFAK